MLPQSYHLQHNNKFISKVTLATQKLPKIVTFGPIWTLWSVVDDQNSQIFWHFYEHLGQMNGKMPEKENISNFWHIDKP